MIGRRQVVENPFRFKIHKKGLRPSFFADIYHHVVAASWFEFFFLITALYMSMNAFFAFLYYIVGDSILNADPYSYWDAFVFSFQTSTTIGYGYFLPATAYAHTIVMLDTLSGLVFFAITTGIAFAKFSRPTARVMFSESVVIHSYLGEKTLMFRVANARASHIVDAEMDVAVVIEETSPEGIMMQRIYDLDLVRSKSPMFFVSWTAMHVIDEFSPLYGMNPDEMEMKNVRIVVSLTGIDDWTAQLLHANKFYRFENIQFEKKFVDILESNEDGSITMDYSRFHHLT